MMRVDNLIVGGGFFGCSVARYMATCGQSALLVDQEADLLQRASYNNQARVHQGYHYPRSLLTALRSRVNFGRFIQDYPECVVGDFTKYYAVGRKFSNVTAAQFWTFCERIGAPIERAPQDVRVLFDADLIEDVFLVKEWAFDAVKLKERMRAELRSAAVEVALQTRAVCVTPASDDALDVALVGREGECTIRARRVFNCTYSGINHLLAASRLPIIPLKHEGTEMALVEPPALLKRLGITVMCGPFFSIMPFPARGLHTLSHVRYTPHHSWEDRADVQQPPAGHRPELHSQFEHMVRDARRYLPCLADCEYRGSLWEVKTVLPASEGDDSRPILFRPHHGLPSLFCIMGGKIDNVYDVMDELKELRSQGGLT